MSEIMKRVKIFLKRFPFAVRLHAWIKEKVGAWRGYDIPEIGAFYIRKDENAFEGIRLNLLVPSVNKADVFGGISTALNFYEDLRKEGNCRGRIIATDGMINPKESVISKDYRLTKLSEICDAPLQLVNGADRGEGYLAVAANDVFVATSWWSAYVLEDVIRWQKEEFGAAHPLIYLVQDYEPGFYPWSSRYMMADSTYRFDFPVYAVINSRELEQYFDRNGYQFTRKWSFAPRLNDSLQAFLPEPGTVLPKKKKILVYGRPGVARNAFEIIVYALKGWVEKMEHPEEWEVLSAGEQHPEVELGKGIILRSTGKMTLEAYAEMMRSTYAGISLMVSPHPSYPPLEMSAFGVKTITNCYRERDISGFSSNITSLQSCSPSNVTAALVDICNHYSAEGIVEAPEEYLSGGSAFGSISKEIIAELTKQ